MRTFLFVLYQLFYVAMLSNDISNYGKVHFPAWTILLFEIFHGGALLIMIFYFIETKSGKNFQQFDINTFINNLSKALVPTLIVFDIAIWIYSTFFVLKISLFYLVLNLIANSILIGPSWYFCYKFAYQRRNLMPPPLR